MDNMIKEINDNLKAIVDNIKSNKDDSISALDNIQNQMDKKVEEAKKYKVEVDSCKDRIRDLEDENRALESSLSELNDKYGKLNLVSIIEAGNKEIKTKINNNVISINKEKEHIAELTNKARTIKDLLISLKKDKTAKEEKLSNLNVLYDYYFEKINNICDYAFDHSNNLSEYKPIKEEESFVDSYKEKSISNDLDNTMVFDEIANIDDNKNFKDEMTFISDQINDVNTDIEPVSQIDDEDKKLDTTQVFDTIFNVDDEEYSEPLDSQDSNIKEDNITSEASDEVNTENVIDDNVEETKTIEVNDYIDNGVNENEIDSSSIFETNSINKISEDDINSVEDTKDENNTLDNNVDNTEVFENENLYNTINTGIINEETLNEGATEDDSSDRLNKINDLFSSLNDVEQTTSVPTDEINNKVNEIENKIDNAYLDVFGQEINKENEISSAPTEEIKVEETNSDTALTDIFGNPISSETTTDSKTIETLFNENGIDFNRFKETEQGYLKQIYDEEKFTKIINVLKEHNIDLENIYNAFNIFGELTSEELNTLIVKLLSIGQSIEAIGVVLEKLPKVKKYDLDGAINSYGSYVKDIDITELIIKAKELYDGGNK